MAIEVFKNVPTPGGNPYTAWTTIVGALTDIATTVTFASGTPLPSGGQFRIVIDNEIMLCTISGATGTLTRGVEGSTAAAHIAGSNVYHLLTTASLANHPRSMTTSGDMEYLNASFVPTRIVIGASGTFLQSNGTVPSWATLGAITPTTVAIGGATIGSNALAVTGTANISGNSTFSGSIISGVTGSAMYRSVTNNLLGIYGDSGAWSGFEIYGHTHATLADKVFLVANTGFVITGGLTMFGGVTSSFPAIKRSTTTIQVRLADDSAAAPLLASKLGGLTSAPSIAGNGTLVADSTDVQGKVLSTVTGAAVITLTFGTAYAVAPGCSGSNETTANLTQFISTTTTLVIQGVTVTGDSISYHCLGT